MREISGEQADRIRLARAERLSFYPPAALEKDIHLSEILRIIASINLTAFKLSFGGGTSLVKGYQLFDRMSEDLDFKVEPNQTLSKSQLRSGLTEAKRAIKAAISEQGFGIRNTLTRNKSSYFLIQAEYKSIFEPIVSLRTTINLEFVNSRLYSPVRVNSIKTLLEGIYQDNVEPIFMPCVSMEQITAEKVISFLIRRYPADPTEFPDPRLVRHLHDVYFLSNRLASLDDVITVFKHVVTEDAARYRNQIPELSTDPIGYLSAQISRFSQDQAIANDYQDFVTSLTLGTPPDIQQVKEAFLAAANRCLTSLS